MSSNEAPVSDSTVYVRPRGNTRGPISSEQRELNRIRKRRYRLQYKTAESQLGYIEELETQVAELRTHNEVLDRRSKNLESTLSLRSRMISTLEVERTRLVERIQDLTVHLKQRSKERG